MEEVLDHALGRIAIGALLHMAACGCLGTVGCGFDVVDACFLDSSPESSYQLAPSGRALAFSDAASCDHIVYRPDIPNPLFRCVLDEFTRLFKNQPDSLVIVFDFENLLVTLERAFQEAGVRRSLRYRVDEGAFAGLHRGHDSHQAHSQTDRRVVHLDISAF